MELNCACDDNFPRKTLAELRAAVFRGLGFIGPQTNLPTRTLGDLRADVIARLGFLDPLAPSTMRTLAELRQEMYDRLGLIEPLTGATPRTLASLVASMLSELGFGAMAAPPPGIRDQLVNFINQAQQTLFRRLELDSFATGAAFPPVMASDSDQTTLDGTPVFALALGMAKAHLGQQDAKLHVDQAEKYLADWAQRRPPNIKAIVDAALREAQRTVARRYELGAQGPLADTPFANDGDITSVDPHAVLLLALGNVKAKIGQPDAKVLLEEYAQYMVDALKRSPPNLAETVTRALQSANQTVFRRIEMGNTDAALPPFAADTDQTASDGHPVYLLAVATLLARFKMDDAKPAFAEYEQYMGDLLRRSPPNARSVVDAAIARAQEVLFQRYDMFRMERWFTWTLQPDERFYGIGDNDEQTATPPCVRSIDARHLTWVGVSQDGNSWRPLRKGIAPTLYAYPSTGVPTHYDVRQCIEVWPAPIAGWQLRIKGHFGLDPLVADTDETTIDWQAVELQALADAKAHYNQPDAQKAAQDAREYVGRLIAGSHQTARYVPGASEPRNAVRPVLV